MVLSFHRPGLRVPLALLLGLCAACQEASAAPAATLPAVFSEQVALRKENAFERRGAVMPRTRMKLGFGAGGVVELVGVEVGDVVKKGQLLARLRSDDAKAQLKSARSARRRSAREARSARRLSSEGALSSQQLQQMQGELSAASAGFAAAKEALAQRVLTAPMHGRVYERLAETGEAVAGGQTILVVEAEEAPTVRVELREEERRFVKPGQEVSLFGEGEKSAHAAVVARVAPSPSQHGLYTVELTPEKGAPDWAPGNMLTARFARQGEPELVVPVDALLRRHDKSWVFVLSSAPEAGSAPKDLAENQALAVLREVETGPVRGRDVTVKKGLTPGQRIVREGAQFLRDGEVVQVLE